MSKTTKSENAAKQQVINQLSQLEGLKAILGEKKFNKRVKKAAKVLAGKLPKQKAPKPSKTSIDSTIATVRS